MDAVYRTEPTLGPRIRAHRLGWGHAPRHGCFIRMSDAGGTNTRVELCPVNAVPSARTKSGFHRVWWESPELLDMLPWLRNVRRVKRYVCVVIDDNGSLVRIET